MVNLKSDIKAIPAPDGRAIASQLKTPDPPDVERAVAALIEAADAKVVDEDESSEETSARE